MPTYVGTYNIKETDIRNDIGFYSLAKHLQSQVRIDGRSVSFPELMSSIENEAIADGQPNSGFESKLRSNKIMLDLYKENLGSQRFNQYFGDGGTNGGIKSTGFILNKIVSNYFISGTWSDDSQFSQFKDIGNKLLVNPADSDSQVFKSIKDKLGVIIKSTARHIDDLTNLDPQEDYNSMQLDGYVPPRTTVKIINDYELRGIGGNSKPDDDTRANGDNWSSSPQTSQKRNHNRSRTAGFKNLCDAAQLNKEINKTNFSINPERIANYANPDNNPEFFTPSSNSSGRYTDFSNNLYPGLGDSDFTAKFRNSSNASSPSSKKSTVKPPNQNRILSLLNQANRNGFYFPLIQNPQTFIDLIMGRRGTDLITYTLPNIGSTARLETRSLITPKPPIFKTLTGDFGVNSRLGFGYDTTGFFNWSENGSKPSEMYRLLDGFYVSDRWSYQNGAGRWLANPRGKDMPEFSIDAGVMAGLEANLGFIRGRIEGGVTGQIGLDFIDQGELTGESDGKLRAYEIEEMFASDPNKMVALQGGLYAALNAAVQIGFDAGLISQWHDIWTQELLKIAIFEFSSVDRNASGILANDPLSGATIFFDANLDSEIGLSEPTTESHASSTYMLSVENKLFDKNDNDSIDFDEGRLIAFGGRDSVTRIHQEIPFVSSFGENINPISTLIRLAVESGHQSNKTVDSVLSMFDLPDKSYQHTDPVQYLKPTKTSSSDHTINKANEYLAHIKIHFLFDSLVGIVQNLFPKRFHKDLASELELLSTISDHVIQNSDESSSANDVLLAGYEFDALGIEGDLKHDIYKSASTPVKDVAADMFGQLDQVLVELKGQSLTPSEFLEQAQSIKAKAFMHVRGLSRHYGQINNKSEHSHAKLLANIKSFRENRIINDYVLHDKSAQSLSSIRVKNIVTGASTRDSIIGSKGPDIINGKDNDDVMIGGDGSDVFLMSNGKDVILDYNYNDGDQIVVDDLKDISIKCREDNLIILNGANKLVVSDVVCHDLIDDVVSIIDESTFSSSLE